MKKTIKIFMILMLALIPVVIAVNINPALQYYNNENISLLFDCPCNSVTFNVYDLAGNPIDVNIPSTQDGTHFNATIPYTLFNDTGYFAVLGTANDTLTSNLNTFDYYIEIKDSSFLSFDLHETSNLIVLGILVIVIILSLIFFDSYLFAGLVVFIMGLAFFSTSHVIGVIIMFVGVALAGAGYSNVNKRK